jgi:Ala-tRNA(Pro) deacylase
MIPHRKDATASEAAQDTHTPGRAFAKAVIVRAGDRYLMAVAPVHHQIDLERLSELVDGKALELASEQETQALCPDCETGAIPPFGNLYNLPVYASWQLAANDEITLIAGGHADALRLPWRDYQRLVHPALGEISDVQQ